MTILCYTFGDQLPKMLMQRNFANETTHLLINYHTVLRFW
jgi:hypothetical protein